MTMEQAYALVIADIAQDIGYEGDAQEVTLSVLKGRLHEITEVHPELFSEDIDKMFSWIPESFTETPSTSIVDELQARFTKFSQEEDTK